MSALDAAVAHLRAGEPVVVVDPIGNLGIAGYAGRSIAPEAVNFLVTRCRGIVYAGAPRSRLGHLQIGRQHGAGPLQEGVLVAVDARAGVTTGVSAADRARTIRTILDPATTRDQLRTPGHVLPNAIDESGDIAGYGLSEALQHLVARAGLGPGVALAGVLDADGEMARADELARFARCHGTVALDVADVLRAQRLAEGWSSPWPGHRIVRLAHTGLDLFVTALDGHRRHGTFEVCVLPYDPAGHTLRVPGPGRDALESALDALHARGRGAVVLASGSAPDADSGTVAALPHVAALVAADLAAADSWKVSS
ncbi:3,4-dihydroxy-2-butanone-4-phosphate synthase [Dactylosporangium sp. CS-033363]|uniref:3,4-dihydroxy-2-butanone-4-phosphate synthase n=1 Tax=Dactylosporangium sp. CS-033363 TaxID=3239935 RepID=UPI003D89E030